LKNQESSTQLAQNTVPVDNNDVATTEAAPESK
jgi:hypothetical protein